MLKFNVISFALGCLLTLALTLLLPFHKKASRKDALSVMKSEWKSKILTQGGTKSILNSSAWTCKEYPYLAMSDWDADSFYWAYVLNKEKQGAQYLILIGALNGDLNCKTLIKNDSTLRERIATDAGELLKSISCEK